METQQWGFTGFTEISMFRETGPASSKILPKSWDQTWLQVILLFSWSTSIRSQRRLHQTSPLSRVWSPWRWKIFWIGSTKKTLDGDWHRNKHMIEQWKQSIFSCYEQVPCKVLLIHQEAKSSSPYIHNANTWNPVVLRTLRKRVFCPLWATMSDLWGSHHNLFTESQRCIFTSYIYMCVYIYIYILCTHLSYVMKSLCAYIYIYTYIYRQLWPVVFMISSPKNTGPATSLLLQTSPCPRSAWPGGLKILKNSTYRRLLFFHKVHFDSCRKFCINYTPPRINIEPENDGLEGDFPFPGVYSQVPC